MASKLHPLVKIGLNPPKKKLWIEIVNWKQMGEKHKDNLFIFW